MLPDVPDQAHEVNSCPGSARDSRAGFGDSPKHSTCFGRKFATTSRRRQHASRVRSHQDSSSRRGRGTSPPPQFGQTAFICFAQLTQNVHS